MKKCHLIAKYHFNSISLYLIQDAPSDVFFAIVICFFYRNLQARPAFLTGQQHLVQNSDGKTTETRRTIIWNQGWKAEFDGAFGWRQCDWKSRPERTVTPHGNAAMCHERTAPRHEHTATRHKHTKTRHDHTATRNEHNACHWQTATRTNTS